MGELNINEIFIRTLKNSNVFLGSQRFMLMPRAVHWLGKDLNRFSLFS